jgi:hypothetical protein
LQNIGSIGYAEGDHVVNVGSPRHNGKANEHVGHASDLGKSIDHE